MRFTNQKRNLVMVIAVLTLVFILFFSCTLFRQQEKVPKWHPEKWHQKYCPLCGMNLNVYRQTCHRLYYDDGRIIGYCSIHCAAIDYRKHKNQVAKIDVADYVSKKFVPVENAYYLVGSDLPGVMTVVSKKAFSFLEVAKKYQEEHGGEIVRFADALDVVYADIDKDMKMLKKKMGKMARMGRVVAEAKGCFKCHGAEGRGCGEAIAWISPRFAKQMDSKVKVKEAIMQKHKGKHSFEGKISEKELQALMLYIWSIREDR